jgi:hypothetical protein
MELSSLGTGAGVVAFVLPLTAPRYPAPATTTSAASAAATLLTFDRSLRRGVKRNISLAKVGPTGGAEGAACAYCGAASLCWGAIATAEIDPAPDSGGTDAGPVGESAAITRTAGAAEGG